MSTAVLEQPGATAPSPGRPGLVRRLLSDRWALAAVILYVGTALVLTWPLPVHLSSQVFGGGGDAWGSIGTLREANQEGLNPFLPGDIHSLGAPEGQEQSYPVAFASWASTGPRWVLSLLIGEVPMWNLWGLSGFILTGLATFLLVRRLTNSAPAALIAGWAYAFYPFAVFRAGVHVEYSQGWLFVLLLWRALELRRAPTRRNGLWAGAALVLCMSYTGYFVLFGGVVVVTLAIVDLALAWRERALRSHAAAWAWGLWMVPVLMALFLAVNLTFDAGSQVRSHPLSELYSYSARPLDYLIPIPGSGLLGGDAFASSYAKGIGVAERGLYLGWTVLALALVGVVALARRAFQRLARQAAAQVAAIGVVAAAFSAVPTYQGLGVTIYMPSWFVFHISSTWRVYGRFVIVVMLAVAVLAGYGVAALLRDRRRVVAAGVAVLIGAAVATDLWWRSDPPTTPLPAHPIYRALAAQRDGTIAAEYPLGPAEVPDYRYAMAQDLHRHPLLNGYVSGSPEEHRALWLAPLDDRNTAARLAALGVRWVVVNDFGTPGVLPPGTPGRGFRFVTKADRRALWHVVAAPARALVYPANGFSAPEGSSGSRYAWLMASQGTVRVDARCPTGCDGVLRFAANSFHVPRTLTVRVGGSVVARSRVTTATRAVEVPLRAGPRTEVKLDVTPAPRSPRTTTGQSDDRPLAITVGEPRFTLDR